MKRSSTVILQVVIVAMVLTALAFMLLEPQIEGRNINATQFQIYFNDLFLVCAYLASIPFFVALWKTFKVLGYAGEDSLYSPSTLKALRIIKYCGRVLVAFALSAEAYLFIVRPEEDIAGGVFMGLLMIVFSGVIAIVATRFEKIVQKNVINNQ